MALLACPAVSPFSVGRRFGLCVRGRSLIVGALLDKPAVAPKIASSGTRIRKPLTRLGKENGVDVSRVVDGVNKVSPA